MNVKIKSDGTTTLTLTVNEARKLRDAASVLGGIVRHCPVEIDQERADVASEILKRLACAYGPATKTDTEAADADA